MATITRERAREIISTIYNKSGGFLKVDGPQRTLATSLGAPVLEAAARAWTADMRFIYELVQNADDASYNFALSEKVQTFVEFYIYPDRIVIHSNQDDFDEGDVEAICSACRSTKTGQIELPTKSIIQSGPFCFSLQHRAGDNGLGMIAPVNEAHEDLSQGFMRVRTRITLLTLKPDLYSSFCSTVRELPPLTFAFLSKVEAVRFYFSDPDLPTVPVSFSPFPGRDPSQHVPGLPARESRPSTEKVEIVLAFPDNAVQLNTKPFSYAYLPLCGTCPWNDHLLSHLPRVFYAALQELCHIPIFEHFLPRFLQFKQLETPHWSQFRDSVLRGLKHIRLFKTRRGTRKSLDEVRFLLPEHCASNGDPLFDDLDEDIYPSSQYAEFYDTLIPFGLQPVSSRQLLDRFRPYLIEPQPRFLHEKLSDRHWTDRVTLLLLSWMDSPLDSVAEELKRLPLVPVRDARWSILSSSEVLKCPSSCTIYFPFDSAGNAIPDSALEMVSVFNVTLAEPSFVLEQIHSLNENNLKTLSVSQAVKNLRYVFSVIQKPHRDSDKGLEPRKEEVYFKTFDNSPTNAVLREVEDAVVASGHPPLQIRFLHPDYTPLFGTESSWMQWLERVGSIRQAPRLETRHSPTQPSDILLSIIEYAPESLVSTPEQKALWSGPHLEGRFPFLSMPSPWGSKNRTEWEFLSRHGVTTAITTDFLIASAKALSRIFPTQHAKDAFFKLYEMLTPDSFEKLCAQMPGTEFVYIPQWGTDDKLVKPSDCLWNGDVSGSKHVLASHDAYARNPKVKQLFQTVLTSQGAEWVTKLSHLQTKTKVSRMSVYDAYKAIMEDPENDCDWTSIRERFEDGDYIYIPHEDDWYPPSMCAWSARPWIDGRCGIRNHYPDPRHFFVEGLRVYQPDILSYIEQMLDIVEVAEIYTAGSSEWLLVMQELNDLKPTADDLEPLRLARFLPVRRKATHITYVTVDEPFFIIDDTRLQLDPKLPVLDITPENACRFRHSLTALGLGERYVSWKAKETTCAVDDAKESTELTHDFRQRAEALCRCMNYYGSRKSTLSREQIQELFSQATVFTATGFRRHFRLDHELATEESHQGRLHYEVAGDALRIYVPWNDKKRAICYATELPHALVSYLEIDHQAACGTFATILRESLDILDDTLGEKGIIFPVAAVPNELPIRTKTQLASKGSNINSTLSSTSTQASHESTVIKLKADEEYIEKQNNGLGYLATLTKKYRIATEDLGASDLPDIVSEYFKVKPDDRELSFTEAALKAAAGSLKSGHMAMLLDDLAGQGLPVMITPSVLETAAANEIYGHEIMFLLRYIPKSRRESIDITGCGPRGCRRERDQGDNITITDTVLETAAGNTECGDALVALLLKHRDPSGWITQDIAVAAARNEGPGHIRVSQALLQAAAKNLHQGAEIMSRLLYENCGDFQITEEILTLLGNFNHGRLGVTERMIDLLLGLRQGGLPITNAVLEIAARNPASTQKELLRLLELSDGKMQVANEFFDIASGMTRKIPFLLRHQGRITESVLVAAASREDYDDASSFIGLLSKSHDPVTDVVFEPAVGNSLYGSDFVNFMLASYTEDIHISETILLAASRNPKSGPEILDLLLKQWPDVPITENVILAAASTNSNAVEKLIRRNHGSPTKPRIQITEELLEALARNLDCGARALRLLLDAQVEEGAVPVTQAALVNAAGNISCGYEVMSLLLDHADENLGSLITEDVTIAAAGNPLWGLEILALLLVHKYPVAFSMRVFAATERNLWSGEEIVAFLLRHQDTETDDEDPDIPEGDNWSDSSTEVPGSKDSDLSGDAYETADDG
ncbi:uncharacterized protein BDV17DRAFT_301079 [Aspergillus undulatus]|uniref:uncharacterized protein n=1 Tax=Aspergillus undulatus TaxID=1810928 RepID=UPI003CCE4C07